MECAVNSHVGVAVGGGVCVGGAVGGSVGGCGHGCRVWVGLPGGCGQGCGWQCERLWVWLVVSGNAHLRSDGV